MNEAAEWGKNLTVLFKDYVNKAVSALNGRVDALWEKVESLPIPKDGKSVTLDDVRPLIDEAVKTFVVPEVTAKLLTLDEVREAVAEAVSAIPAAQDGKDADPEAIRAMVAEAVAALPLPKDGKDADPEVIRVLVEEAVKAIPVPKDGESVTVEQVMPALLDDVQKAIDALPIPKDGKDATPVTVEDFRQMFDAEQAKWALDFERRAQDVLQRAIDRIPTPKDGTDGLGFDDLVVEDDGDGNAMLKFTRGEQVKEFAIHLPRIVDKGVYRPENAYTKGDGVTYGGSFWIAQKDAPEGKPDGGDGWRLAVKRGRDGKDGVVIEKPKPGPVRLP